MDTQSLSSRERGGVVVESRRSGIVEERRTPNPEDLGSIPTGTIVLCPSARHFNSLQYWLNPGSVGSVPT